MATYRLAVVLPDTRRVHTHLVDHPLGLKKALVLSAEREHHFTEYLLELRRAVDQALLHSQSSPSERRTA